MCGPGDEDAHGHASPRRLGERVRERRPRHEVSGGDVHRVLGRRDHEVVQRLDVGVADLGRRADELHRHAVLERLQVRQMVLTGEHLSGALEPVLRERPLHPPHHRPSDANVGVAPVIRVLRISRPLGGDADPPGHPDPPVGDQEAAMGAVGDPPHRVGLGRPKPDHPDARILHVVDQASVHLRGAERVQDDPALDAVLCLRADLTGDLARDLAPPVDVRLNVQRALRGRDRLEEGGKDPVAVDEQLGHVSLRDRRARERLGRAQELGRVDRDRLGEVVPERTLAPVPEAVGGVPAERCAGEPCGDRVSSPRGASTRSRSRRATGGVEGWIRASPGDYLECPCLDAAPRPVGVELAVDVESGAAVRADLRFPAAAPAHAALRAHPARAEPVRVGDEPRSRACLENDHVETSVARVGVDRGAAAECAGHRDADLPPRPSKSGSPSQPIRHRTGRAPTPAASADL